MHFYVIVVAEFQEFCRRLLWRDFTLSIKLIEVTILTLSWPRTRSRQPIQRRTTMMIIRLKKISWWALTCYLVKVYQDTSYCSKDHCSYIFAPLPMNQPKILLFQINLIMRKSKHSSIVYNIENGNPHLFLSLYLLICFNWILKYLLYKI